MTHDTLRDKPGGDGEGDRPPPADATPGNAGSVVWAELARLLERLDAAHRACRAATGLPDREAAEAVRREAAGELWYFRQGLADLALLLIRHALEYRREALCASLAEALRPELDLLAESIAKLEGHR